MSKPYPHQMLKEIYEQPEVAARIFDFYQSGAAVKAGKAIKKAKRLLFLGSGSSYNAALLGKYYFEEYGRKPAEAEITDEFINRQAILDKNTLVVAISQSGKTGSALKALRIARRKGARVLALTGQAKSPLAAQSDYHLELLSGEEKAVAATKTFLASILHLALLSQDLSGRSLKTEASLVQAGIEAGLKLEPKIRKIASSFKKIDKITVLGTKFNYPLAREAGQKISETCYVQASAMSAQEFRHGPEAAFSQGSALLFLSSKETKSADRVVWREAQKLDADIFLLTDFESRIAKSLLVENSALAGQLGFLVVLQLFSYHLALSKGIDPDHLRNISKYVAK